MPNFFTKTAIACLLLTASLFADPFIVFPESFRKPPKSAVAKSKSIDSTAIYNDPFLSPIALDNFEPVELNPPNGAYSFIAIGNQERIDKNRCAVNILYVVKDSLKQFRSGERFITNCGRDYLSGLRYLAGNEVKPKTQSSYNHSNVILVESQDHPLSYEIYFPGRFLHTDGYFFKPSYLPEGYIACPEVIKTDSVKESLVQDVLARERLYLYGTPYSGKKPDFKNDSLFIDLERPLRLQGKNPKDFYKRLLTGRDSIRITPYDKPYVAMGAIHAMREKIFAGDTLCEIDFKAAYTFKDSLCQTNFKDVRIFKNDNPCNIETGFGENLPYAAKHEPKYNAYKKGACFPAKDFKFNRYVFGEKDKSGTLRIDSLLPMQEFLYNEGELVDLRMGFSIVDIHKALYPAAYSYDDAHFYDIVTFHKIGTLPVPERHRKEIEAGARRVFNYCHLPERDYFK